MEVKEIKHGYVKSIFPEKGYAFIRSVDDNEDDYYVRIDSVLGGTLKRFQEVEFLPQDTSKGPIALNTIIRKDVPVMEIGEKETSVPEMGYVKSFDDERGYGFITSSQDNVTDYFAYYVNINSEGHKTLRQGQKVQFLPVDTAKGPLALNITVVEDVKN